MAEREAPCPAQRRARRALRARRARRALRVRPAVDMELGQGLEGVALAVALEDMLDGKDRPSLQHSQHCFCGSATSVWNGHGTFSPSPWTVWPWTFVWIWTDGTPATPREPRRPLRAARSVASLGRSSKWRTHRLIQSALPAFQWSQLHALRSVRPHWPCAGPPLSPTASSTPCRPAGRATGPSLRSGWAQARPTPRLDRTSPKKAVQRPPAQPRACQSLRP